MRVLKTPPAEQASNLASFAFGDLGEAATQQLAAARREATELLARAREEAETIRRQAEQAGRAAAEQEISMRVAQQAATLLPALEQAVNELRSARAECLRRWEESALGVAVAIASRVIRREVTRHPEITLDLVREALELAAGSTDVQLRMHPDDIAAFNSQIEDLLAQLARGERALIPDAGISPGGCRVETRAGSIDQRLEAQLARIEQELQ